ncbi:hypothetical protein [Phenylobacterium sp.]|uniref:hypothetical protein n=1 Tax=Phenylobacterium sp. TaxID=1871053 RepID=UPI003D2E77FB
MASGDDARPLGGFHSYADDTPRDDVADETPVKAGWSDTPAWRRAEAPPEPRLWRSPLVAGCAVVALLAAGVGWATLGYPGRPPAPAQPPEVEAPAPSPLQVVIAEPPSPAPLAPAAERLEVLPPPQMNAAAEGAPPARMVIPSPPPEAALPRETPSAAASAQAAGVRTAPETSRFDACADAPTPAYEMVCSDRWLAQADQRMKRAYSAAMAAGVPPEALQRDQEDWLAVREDAAQVSRRAVADIYRQRTRELFAMADDR